MATRPSSKRTAGGAELLAASPPGAERAGAERSVADHDISDVRVVGIGASAGGLDAFIDLVSAIPPGTLQTASSAAISTRSDLRPGKPRDIPADLTAAK
jgi:chemotaxis response regulator CheB